MMTVYCRLYSSDGQDLVLTGCSAKVAIVDVHASVLMSQKFRNLRRNPFTSAVSSTYTFSMLAGSAINGFEMIREDGTKVEGIVKEKEQAKKEYKEAVSQGYTAGLGEEQTKDVFSISVGNILPFETVTINLHFLQPLTDDERRDQLRFTFPRAYAQRYGSAPTSEAAMAASTNQPFSLEMSIQQAAPIKNIACPSGQSIAFELGPPEGVEPSHFAKVALNEPSGLLTQDVLVVITAADLDAPRCFIEPHPSPNQPTTAVGLTFVPRFKLPDAEGGMEYIFLIDRSGSMEGESIKLVREALVVLLRGLPTKDTSFNLVSFGSGSSKLWPVSKNYTQQSLDEATRHIDKMQADYGGTEIASALAAVFNSLRKPLKKPVSVFLLTDGGAWDIQNCVAHTETALRNLPADKTFLRVFTVGIGNGVSTNTCDSIARAGKGISIYVSQGEAMTGKCSRLIRAARTPPVVDLKVSWPGLDNAIQLEKDDTDFELVESDGAQSNPVQQPETINLFQSNDDDEDKSDVGPPPKRKVSLPPPPPIQQAPITLPSLFPGTRAQFYAIVSDFCFPKTSTLPKFVKVRGTVAPSGVKVELDVPLAKLLVSPSENDIKPILHTLAAKALITEREHGKHSFSSSLAAKLEKDSELKAACIEQDIVRLGTTYSLTSKHTSFVAVDRKNSSQTLSARQPPIAVSTREPELKPAGFQPRILVRRGRPATSALVGGATPGEFSGAAMKSLVPPPPTPPAPALSHGFLRMAMKSLVPASAAPPPPVAMPAAVQQALTASLLSRSKFMSAAESVDLDWEEVEENDNDDDDDDDDDDDVPLSASCLHSRSTGGNSDRKSLTAGERLVAIARLQAFNGGFQLTKPLLELLSCSIIDTATVEFIFKLVPVETDVGATLLAWRWLWSNVGEDVVDMIEKTEEYLKDKLGSDVVLSDLADKVSSFVPFA